MFGIGGFELFIILVFGFLIFGPDKLPEIAKTVGKAIARFRSAQEEVNSVIKPTDIYDPNDPEQPFKDPIEALDKLAQRQEEKRAGRTGASQPSASEPDAAPAAQADGTAAKQESFSERKARYERERAARKAAEAEAAASATEAADKQDGAPAEEGASGAGAAHPQDSETADGGDR